MNALFEGVNHAVLAMNLPLATFLRTQPMREQARRHHATVTQLICDHVRAGVDSEDDEELAQAYAEACMLASDFVVHQVRLSDEDLCFVRERFCGQPRLSSVTDDGLLPPAA